MLLLLLLLLASLVALGSGETDTGRLDQTDGVVSQTGQTEAGGSQAVVRSRRLLDVPWLRGWRAGLVAVLRQQVGGRSRGSVAGAVLGGAIGSLAGVARRLLAGEREALGRPRVDQLVVAVVTEHHLLQPAGAHRVVLEAPRAGLDVAGRGH